MKIGTGARFRTHAKVNLFLRVLGARPDGFHDVETILQGINLHDEFEVTPGRGSVDIAMELATGRTGRLPEVQENLVYRAAERLLSHHGSRVGADIRVVKGIPIGAGLGGGSGNAAGTLVILAELWGIELERTDLLRFAGELGSDVPYCINGGLAFATERGQKITQLPSRDIEMWFVLGGMNYPLSTRAVYEAWDSLPDKGLDGPSGAPFMLALGAGDLAEVGAHLHNDLEAAAFSLRGELEGKKAKMAAAGVLGASMTGSGPTIFGLSQDEERARAAAARVEDDFDWIEIVSSRSECIQRLE